MRHLPHVPSPRTAARLAGIAVVLASLAAAPSLRAQRVDSAAAAPPTIVRSSEPLDKPRLRMEFLMQRRAYPVGEVPTGALQAAKREMRRRWPQDEERRRAIARELQAAPLPTMQLQAPGAPGAAVATAPVLTPERWTALGPTSIPGFGTADAGRVAALAVDPRDSRVIYAGGAQGGVWKTTDGGASWTARSDAECSLAIGALALDPVNPDIVYVGTGEQNFSGDSYYGCGMLRSIDAGATWTRLGAAEWDIAEGGAQIGRIVVDRASAGTTTTTILHAATSYGLYRSTNAGATWTRMLAGGFTDVVAEGNGGTLYAARTGPWASSTNRLYKSADRGLTWTAIGGNFPTTDVGRVALAVAASAPGTVYAAVQDAFGAGAPASDGGLLGIWRSTDAGATWTKLTAASASCGTQCWYDIVVAVNPQNAHIVYFGGIQLFGSSDGGQSFTPIGNNVHVDHHAIAFDAADPRIVFAGSDGGVYRSADGGWSWTSLNTNLELTQFYGGLSARADALDIVMGGTQDNGTVEYRNGTPWPRVLGGDGGFTAIDPGDPGIAYAETQWSRGSGYSGPRRRDTPTGPFNLRVSGIALDDRALFIPPLVPDPARPAVLYFGTYRLYRTMDRGDTWTAISGDLSRSAGSGVVSAIAPSRRDPQTIYVGTSDGHVQVTRDGGATWTPRIAGLPNRYIEDFAVDPADERHAYVVVSSFGSGHVFRTQDAGVTWTDVSGNLPNMPVNAVALLPTGELYVGTDLGVFHGAPGGNTWTPFTAGFPNVAVYDLLLHEATGTLLAATHGRGVFAAPVAIDQVVATVAIEAPFDTLTSGQRATATVRATDARGIPVRGVAPEWSSSAPAVLAVSPAGELTAGTPGRATITATVDGVSASRAFVVTAPSVLVVRASAIAGTAPVSSAAASRVPLLRVVLFADGGEPMQVTQLGFRATGRGGTAQLALAREADGDGAYGVGDADVADGAILLDGTETTLRPPALVVPARDSLVVYAIVAFGAGAPNLSELSLEFVPARTMAVGARSRRDDLKSLPPQPVASTRRTTVLGADEVFALSENPVRGDRVVFNFSQRPRTAAVYTLTGRRVADLVPRLDGDGRVEWDLTNEQGAPVAAGVYFVVFDVGGRVVREKLFVTRAGAAREE